MLRKTTEQQINDADDRGNINDAAEKKRMQNRIAQRNYRRNMKQKIRELEQQVNTQANMLAFLGEPAHPWISVETPQFHGVEGIDCSGPSQPLSPEASKAIPAPYTLSTTSPPHSIQGVTTKPAYVPHRGLVWSPEAVSGEAIDTSGAGDTYPNEKIGTPSPTSGSVVLPQPQEEYERPRSQSLDNHLKDEGSVDFQDHREATAPFCGYDKGGNVHSWPSLERVEVSAKHSAEAPIASVDEQFQKYSAEAPIASVDEQFQKLLKFSREAGFENFDAAVLLYYTAKLRSDICKSVQEVSCRQRLPVLLQKLQSTSETWGVCGSERYRDVILRSAERILLSELNAFSASAKTTLKELTKPDEQQTGPIDWKRTSCFLQAELPNVWFLTSTLLHKSFGAYGARIHSQLTAFVLSLFMAAEDCYPKESRALLACMMCSA